MTGGPLLETKFHLPSPHGPLVPRARLREQIARATSATLTLVSAPAGFGKTTVMAELAHRPNGATVAWLSLEPADDDPVTFWTYVIEAVDRAVPGLGRAARSNLAAGPGSVDVAVTILLNALAGTPTAILLLLDDVHVIESVAIHQQIGYFLEHLPGQAHVVIGTRADPVFPLARLRARGRLVEIRASDLRFSPEEAASYLAGMGLSLASDDIATLEARTEGWIAALQLAALSLQGRVDPTEFISAFAGDDRYIVDYLVEEVLRQQAPDVREFLLQTSILSRFTGPLADAVTAREGGATTIEALDRANLFVVALDNQRRWYRYHHLFGGVLLAYLVAERPDQLPALHRRASEWYERNGDRGESIEHAFKAGDHERAAELIELAMPEMRQARREPTLRRWIDAMPRDVIARRPVLAITYAGSILSANEVEGVEELLDGAEEQLARGADGSDTEQPLAADLHELQRLPAMLELYRGAVAKLRGDLAGNIAHAQRVLELVGEEDHVGRGGAAAFLGLAYWGMGDLEGGYRWYAEAMDSLEKAGHVADLVGGSIVRADIRLAEGRLRDAERIYADGLALATASQPPLRGTTDMHTGLADMAYQHGHLEAAKTHLALGRTFGDELAFPRDPYRSRVVQARIAQAERDIDLAMTLLDEAERLYLSEFSPDVRPVPAIRARMLVAHGRLADARAWAKGSALSTRDELTYVREFEHNALARFLIAETAEGRSEGLQDAIGLLDRLLAAAQHGRRKGSRLEILVTQALARHAAGDASDAFATLAEAIAIAEPEGYVRVFLDEGPAMTRLLKAAARRSNTPRYVHELARAAGGPTEGSPAAQGLVEPLSDRELEVLRLLRSDLGGPDIARELVVSLNTLRTHTKNVYAKLGVGSRRAAVRRAEELDLL